MAGIDFEDYDADDSDDSEESPEAEDSGKEELKRMARDKEKGNEESDSSDYSWESDCNADDRHSTTGLVEKHVDLQKTLTYKLGEEGRRLGLPLELEDYAMESCMCQNIHLTYGGVTSSMGVSGTQPRSLFEFETNAQAAYDGQLQGVPDPFEAQNSRSSSI